MIFKASRWGVGGCRFTFLWCAVMLGACGYRISSMYSGTLPGNVRRISIPVFQNDTGEEDIEVFFTQSLRTRVASNPSVTLVASGSSQAVLKGHIRRVSSYPLATPVGEDRSVYVALWRITVVVDVRLEVAETGEVLWAGTGFTGVEEYMAAATAVATESGRRAAVARLASRLMATVCRNLLDGF